MRGKRVGEKQGNLQRMSCFVVGILTEKKDYVNQIILCQKKEIEKTEGLKFCRMVEVQYYQSFFACA